MDFKSLVTFFAKSHVLFLQETIILPLLSSVLSDPKLWKNPDNFDPENFLDEEGQFKRNDAFVVFGMGELKPRICIMNLNFLTLHPIYN